MTLQKELFTSTKQVNDSRPRFESSFRLLSSQLGSPPAQSNKGHQRKLGGKGCVSGGEQKEGAGRPTRRWLSSLARLGIGLARRQMNVSREAGFARRALASASPACPQPAAPAEFRGAGRVRTFLSLSQAAQPDTWGQDYRSHHACEAGGRRGTEGRKGKQGEEENLTCWQR